MQFLQVEDPTQGGYEIQLHFVCWIVQIADLRCSPPGRACPAVAGSKGWVIKCSHAMHVLQFCPAARPRGCSISKQIGTVLQVLQVGSLKDLALGVVSHESFHSYCG